MWKAIFLMAAAAVHCRAQDDLDDEFDVEVGSGGDASRANWKNTDITTLMWQQISSGQFDEFAALLEKDEDLVNVRAEDGRGPLWWAYEHKRTEFIELLQSLGVNEDARDGDGKRASDMVNGPEATKYAAELEKRREAKRVQEQIRMQQEAMLSQYRTCPACVQAGYGWSATERRCGNFENKECAGNDSDYAAEYDPDFDGDEDDVSDEEIDPEDLEDDFDF